jgi:peptide/nickel transport system substrate-binding protein
LTRLAGTLALGLAAACAAPRPAPSAGRVLRIAISDDLPSLDPNRVVDTVSESVLFNVYEPLVGFDDKLGIRTLLAESWEHPAPERWRFRLRRGVVFHDGVPLDATLVRDALLAVQRAPDLEASEFLSQVSDIVAVDASTLDLVTREPRALLPNLPVVFVTKPNTAGGFPPSVGTGPYRIARQSTENGEIDLERAPGYWGPSAHFDRVTFVAAEDPKTRVGLLKRGLADIVYELPPALVGELPDDAEMLRSPGVALFYAGFDLRDRPGNPLRVPAVRRALHLAADRDRIVTEAQRGMGVASGQPAPPAVFGFDPALEPPRADPQAARELLKQAGYAKGFALSIDASPDNAPAARVLAEDWRGVGVAAEVHVFKRDEVYDRAGRGQSQVFVVGWSYSSGEASEFLEYCLHTPTGRLGFNNLGAYSNPLVDAAASENPTLLDTVERQRRLQRAMRLVMDDLPVLPLYVADDVYGVRRGLRFRPRADGEIWLPDVRQVDPAR